MQVERQVFIKMDKNMHTKNAPKMTYLKKCVFFKQVYVFPLPFSTLYKNFPLSACKYLVCAQLKINNWSAL